MKKAIIFDMDGVLADVSQSYRTAIQRTLLYFLGETISAGAIQGYKNRGGLNNDWDLTAQILRERGRVVPREEVIGVFQNIYLGNNGAEGFDGLIASERWLLPTTLLARAAARFPVGIVTGRPRMEAEYTLRRFGVQGWIRRMITMDDIALDRGKPHPDGILRMLELLEVETGWYFGDTVDDMRAASAAGVMALGVVPPGVEPDGHQRILLAAGARAVMNAAADYFTSPNAVAPELGNCLTENSYES